MTNTKQELIAIRDGAPSGATHIDEDDNYYGYFMITIDGNQIGGDWHYWENNQWIFGEIESSNSKLDDIRAQIKLMEENEKLATKVAELENHKAHMIELAKNHGCDSITRLAVKCGKQNKQITELEREGSPNEQGTNRYGLDVAYFRKTINRELNHDISNYTPSELARVLARLSRTADSKVMFEPEFAADYSLEQQAKGVEDAASQASAKLFSKFTGEYADDILKSVCELMQKHADQLRNKAGEL